jgi:hypothetical protein
MTAHARNTPRHAPSCLPFSNDLSKAEPQRYATLAASTYIRSESSPYQGPSCIVARAKGGSKEDGTHLHHGFFQPFIRTVTHPPWIGIFLLVRV